jgi:predicted nucleotidyltransferase
MNIHINEDKFLTLSNAPKVGTFEIGSVLYGMNDEHSDKDYLTIYYPFKNQIFNPFVNHHQFQYKDIENNIDHNFVDIITFVKNLVSGDSVINFELVFSNQFVGTELDFLYRMRKEFCTYNVAKAYLGFAKRDCTQLHKRKTEHDRRRGIMHIERSYLYAMWTMLQKFDLMEFKNGYTGNFDKLFDGFDLNEVLPRIDSFRKLALNKALEEGRIMRYLNPWSQEVIAGLVTKLVETHPNHSTINLSDIYNTNENPELKYESTT